MHDGPSSRPSSNSAYPMPKSESAHPDQVTQNPKSGKLERVFVNLEAVYGANGVAEAEHSFEELRALHRGWLSRDWRKTKSPTRTAARKLLVNASGNAVRSPGRPSSSREDSELSQLADDVKDKVVVSVDEASTLSLSESQPDENVPPASSGDREERVAKPKRIKVREIKQEPKTSKLTFSGILVLGHISRPQKWSSTCECHSLSIRLFPQFYFTSSPPYEIRITLTIILSLSTISQDKFRIPHQTQDKAKELCRADNDLC